MKRILVGLGAAVLTAAMALSMSACGDDSHAHKWGEWQNTADGHSRHCTVEGCDEVQTSGHMWDWKRNETEHWQVCSVNGCTAEGQRGTHADRVCDTCAEFRVIAFGFNQGGDEAHADFAVDANKWFPETGKEYGFTYDYSNTGEKGWVDLNEDNIANYDLIMLLNDKPGSDESRAVFKEYVDNGGACMAFHAAGFAMWSDPETPPNEWEDWFSNTFLRCGVYGYCPRVGIDTAQGAYYWNTWNPTSEPMKIETHDHFSTENLEFDEFVSAPCEWYEWYHNLFEDEDTTVLISMNPTPENPAGDQPSASSAHEIWKDGHHAIAWTNSNYNMIYMNWGHNLQSYNNGAEGKQSSTFSSEEQNQFMIEAMFGLVNNK